MFGVLTRWDKEDLPAIFMPPWLSLRLKSSNWRTKQELVVRERGEGVRPFGWKKGVARDLVDRGERGPG